MAFAHALLKQDFDFNGKDGWAWDRKNAPWAADSKALDVLWREYVKNDVLRLKLAGKNMDEIRKTLGKRYSELATRAHLLSGEDVFQTFLDSPHRVIIEFTPDYKLSFDGSLMWNRSPGVRD